MSAARRAAELGLSVLILDEQPAAGANLPQCRPCQPCPERYTWHRLQPRPDPCQGLASQ
nr:hypothetical protein [Yoonia sp.]